MTSYQLHSDTRPESAADTAGSSGVANPSTLLLQSHQGDDGGITQVFHQGPWLFLWLCVSTATTGLLSCLALLVLSMAGLLFADNPTTGTSRFLFYIFLLGVPALLIWASIVQWRQYKQEQDNYKAFLLSLPSPVIGLVVLIIVIVNSTSA